MYAIYGNIYHQYTPNVSIYTIHGSYGLWYKFPSWWLRPLNVTWRGNGQEPSRTYPHSCIISHQGHDGFKPMDFPLPRLLAEEPFYTISFVFNNTIVPIQIVIVFSLFVCTISRQTQINPASRPASSRVPFGFAWRTLLLQINVVRYISPLNPTESDRLACFFPSNKWPIKSPWRP